MVKVKSLESIVKRVLTSVGYDTNYEIINNLGKQSPDIAMGTNDEVGGAGDQGMMFGYAVNDTKELLPTAMVILQRFSKWYDKERQNCSYLRSDGKAEITGYYDDNMKLKKIKYFTISYQNDEEHRDYTDSLIKEACINICKAYDIEIEEFLINPTVVDSYQSFCKVGGGAFSGKDPTKVDRSSAYKARLIAKDYLSKYNLSWCEVVISYAIGIDKPLSIYINSDKGYIEPDESLYLECTPKNIINDLDLLNVCYEEKARFGHFQD